MTLVGCKVIDKMDKIESSTIMYKSVAIPKISDLRFNGQSIELFIQGQKNLKNLDEERLRKYIKINDLNIESIHLPVLYLSGQKKALQYLHNYSYSTAFSS